MGHNFFRVHLKASANPHYAGGQVAGHELALVLAGIEAAIGFSLIGVGIFVSVTGVIPTSGAIEIVAVPPIMAGALLVGHSIYGSTRARSNLTEIQGSSSNIKAGLPDKYLELIKKYRLIEKAAKLNKVYSLKDIADFLLSSFLVLIECILW